MQVVFSLCEIWCPEIPESSDAIANAPEGVVVVAPAVEQRDERDLPYSDQEQLTEDYMCG